MSNVNIQKDVIKEKLDFIKAFINLEQNPMKEVIIEDKPSQRMKIFFNLEDQNKIFEMQYQTDLFEQIITTQSYEEGVTCQTK